MQKLFLMGRHQAALALRKSSGKTYRPSANCGNVNDMSKAGDEWPLISPKSATTEIKTGQLVEAPQMVNTDAYRGRKPIAVSMAFSESIRTRLGSRFTGVEEAIAAIARSRRKERLFASA